METKVDQKYKGVRRIERRLILPKKQLTKYPKDYIHRKKNNIEDSKFWFWGQDGYPEFKQYTY